MVIYTELCNEQIVNSSRLNLPTKVIYTKLEETPFYYTRDKVENIITSSSFKERIQHPNGLENRCFDYIPIVNGKYKWMSEAIKNNHFNTEMFFWIDAGLSRFMNFNVADGQFNRSLINKLNTENKIYIQAGKMHEFEMVVNNQMTLEYAIGKNINFMMAGFWGGNSGILLEICIKGSNMYIEEFINKERVDNEQVSFGFIIKDYIENTMIVHPGNRDYINYYAFCDKL
jgi:Bacterial protein of unknown function (HtrL_YibB)